MKKRKLGQLGIYTGVLSGSGYIYIPNDITDRDRFISDCYNTATVSILTVEGQRFDKVEVNRTIFYDLDFPETVNDLGSLVFWVKHQKHNQPIIVSIINKKGEVLGFQKGEFVIKKDTVTGLVSILGDGNKGNMFINVQSDEGGNIVINAHNSNKDNIVKLNVDGNIQTISNNFFIKTLEEFSIIIKNDLEDDETQTILKYARGEGFTYLDQFDNNFTITEDGFKWQNGDNVLEFDKDGKLVIKNNNYSLKELIIQIYTLLEQLKISTSIGLQPPTNLVNITLSKEQDISKIFK